MNAYELLYVVTPDLDEETTRAVEEKFAGILAANGGEVTKTDLWGKRKLAYPIQYKTEGHYVLVEFDGPPELPRELERNLKNDERILRFLVTRRDA
ncbi:MAG: 30S ribosomal protein S6 [Clostridiales bacterium]|nr:30S ribosomal protein S6 [Clostridiales bacterium]